MPIRVNNSEIKKYAQYYMTDNTTINHFIASHMYFPKQPDGKEQNKTTVLRLRLFLHTSLKHYVFL